MADRRLVWNRVAAALVIGGCSSGTGGVAASSVRPSASSASSDPGCEPPATVSIQAGRTPPPVCVPVGRTVRFSAEASPRQPWGPVVSSRAAVLGCTSHPRGDGSVEADCTARQPGTATVSTTTGNFAGDPHGPPVFRWLVKVVVR